MSASKSLMKDLVAAIGGNLQPRENRKAWLARVAAVAGLHPRLVEAVWWGDGASWNTQQKLRSAAEAKQNETRELAARLEQIASRMAAIDPDFHREDMAALRDLATRYRGLDRGEK
jgi:hypothetical protein